MKKLLAYIKILRPLNLCIGAFAVVITASILNELEEFQAWFLALLVVVLYNGAANAVNDYFDQGTDKINRPYRPLVTGILKPKEVVYLFLILFGIGTVLAFTLPSQATIIAVGLALPLMVLYSVKFKSIPLLGNFIISLILGVTFLFAAAALGDIDGVVILAILAFGLTMVRELIKDIADYNGDVRARLRTFPTVFGINKSWILSIVFSVIIGIGAIIPYVFGYFNTYYLIILILGIEIPLLVTVFFAVKYPTIDNAKKVARLLKFSTIMGVFAFWLGSVK